MILKDPLLFVILFIPLLLLIVHDLFHQTMLFPSLFRSSLFIPMFIPSFALSKDPVGNILLSLHIEGLFSLHWVLLGLRHNFENELLVRRVFIEGLRIVGVRPGGVILVPTAALFVRLGVI